MTSVPSKFVASPADTPERKVAWWIVVNEEWQADWQAIQDEIQSAGAGFTVEQDRQYKAAILNMKTRQQWIAMQAQVLRLTKLSPASDVDKKKVDALVEGARALLHHADDAGVE
jgi:hypothetical protein